MSERGEVYFLRKLRGCIRRFRYLWNFIEKYSEDYIECRTENIRRWIERIREICTEVYSQFVRMTERTKRRITYTPPPLDEIISYPLSRLLRVMKGIITRMKRMTALQVRLAYIIMRRGEDPITSDRAREILDSWFIDLMREVREEIDTMFREGRISSDEYKLMLSRLPSLAYARLFLPYTDPLTGRRLSQRERVMMLRNPMWRDFFRISRLIDFVGNRVVHYSEAGTLVRRIERCRWLTSRFRRYDDELRRLFIEIYKLRPLLARIKLRFYTMVIGKGRLGTVERGRRKTPTGTFQYFVSVIAILRAEDWLIDWGWWFFRRELSCALKDMIRCLNWYSERVFIASPADLRGILAYREFEKTPFETLLSIIEDSLGFTIRITSFKEPMAGILDEWYTAPAQIRPSRAETGVKAGALERFGIYKPYKRYPPTERYIADIIIGDTSEAPCPVNEIDRNPVRRQQIMIIKFKNGKWYIDYNRKFYTIKETEGGGEEVIWLPTSIAEFQPSEFEIRRANEEWSRLRDSIYSNERGILRYYLKRYFELPHIVYLREHNPRRYEEIRRELLEALKRIPPLLEY